MEIKTQNFSYYWIYWEWKIKTKTFNKFFLTFLLVISGLVKSFAEVFIDNPWDLSNVMSVEDDIPRQVLGCPVQLILSVAFSEEHILY